MYSVLQAISLNAFKFRTCKFLEAEIVVVNNHICNLLARLYKSTSRAIGVTTKLESALVLVLVLVKVFG